MKSINSLENIVFSEIKRSIDPSYTFHDLEHTKWVAAEVLQICDYYQLESKERELIYLAALCHDVGYIKSDIKNEPYGAFYAKELLSKYDFTGDEIEYVSQCILETDVDRKCSFLGSKILCDADLGYLGTHGYEKWSSKLKQEYINHDNFELTEREWLEKQILFIESHVYYTSFSKFYRLPIKEQNLIKLKDQLEVQI